LFSYTKKLTSEIPEKFCTHGIQHGLTYLPANSVADENQDDHDGCGNDHNDNTQCRKRCKGCLFVEYFMRQLLLNAIEKSRTEWNKTSVDDARTYISDCLLRFRLYQGCRIRVRNQQIEIEKIDQDLKDEVAKTKAPGTKASLTVDWKMKFNEERLRESQIHNYGIRGISWHVAVLTYYAWDLESKKPERVQVSFDQILATGNKQDGLAVLSDLEALLVKVKHEIPQIRDIILCSDNAACYHKKAMLLFIPILNAQLTTLKVSRVIHTETQDGKGACDSHGAISHRHVKKNFLLCRDEKTEQKGVCTPFALAAAIACKGGVKNNGKKLFDPIAHLAFVSHNILASFRQGCS
jgi:hypothetical protein